MRGSVLMAYAWRNMFARRVSTAVTLVAIAAAVLVSVVMASMADGIGRIATGSGAPENLIVLSKGASGAEASILDRWTLHRLAETDGLRQASDGSVAASAELLVVQAASGVGGERRYITLRGVTPTALDVHGAVEITAGRWPQRPGEILIGRLVPANLGPVSVGDEIVFGGRPRRVVGAFAAGGQVFEGEIWMRLEDLRQETGRRGASIVTLATTGPGVAADVRRRIEGARHIDVDVERETDYYGKIREASTAFVFLGNLIGWIMGLGAALAGMNTMYAAMSRRVREMGTLRALGFGRRTVGGLVLLESALVGALGGALGVALAMAVDERALHLLGLSFELDVRPDRLAQGCILALAVGVGGGWLPARNASRLGIVEALRHR